MDLHLAVCAFSKLEKGQKITDVTSESGLPGGAEASSCHGVTWSVVLTVAHLGTAATVGTLFAH